MLRESFFQLFFRQRIKLFQEEDGRLGVATAFTIAAQLVTNLSCAENHPLSIGDFAVLNYVLEAAIRQQGLSVEDFKANIRNNIITSEVIRDALRDWKSKRVGAAREIEHLRRLLAEGHASGSGPWEGVEPIIAEARRRLAAGKG